MSDVSKRNYYFDNAKFILILLVVIGHLIEPIININEYIKAIYIFIYVFHMPCFILISGYFSKQSKKEGGIIKLIYTYIIFQIIYYLFNVYVLNNDVNFTLTTPYWILWFLLSLILWKLITPYFIKIKYPILVAFIIGVLIGYEPTIGYYLSLSRTIVFYPFFLIGYLAKEESFKNLSTKMLKRISVIGMIAIFIFAVNNVANIDLKMLYESVPYSQMKGYSWHIGIQRVIMYIFNCMAVSYFLILVPKRKLYISNMGRNTLQVFLLHGFVVKLLLNYKVYGYVNSGAEIIILIIGGIVLSLLLSMKWITILLAPILKPKIDFIYRNNERRV